MQVGAALLADFAQVREGLLFVVGGGITRIYRPELPAPMNVCLVLAIELHRMERDQPHELNVQIMDDDGGQVAEIKGGFQMQATDAAYHEAVNVPMVFDLRVVGLARYGFHVVEVSIDGHHERTLQFLVAAPPATEPAA